MSNLESIREEDEEEYAVLRVSPGMPFLYKYEPLEIGANDAILI